MLNNNLRKRIKTKQQEYLLLKAAIMAAEEIEEENKIKILKENVFIDDEGVRVTDPGEDWLIEDISFIRYLKMVAEENRKAGLKINNYDEVIMWEEKQSLKKVADELLKLQLETIPNNLMADIKRVHNHWKYRDEALELILKLEV